MKQCLFNIPNILKCLCDEITPAYTKNMQDEEIRAYNLGIYVSLDLLRSILGTNTECIDINATAKGNQLIKIAKKYKKES